MGRRRTLLLSGAVAPIIFVLVVVAAWAIDAGASGGEVLRNVHLAGVDIGGLSGDELVERIESLDAALENRPVRIETPEVAYETTASEIGLTVDALMTAENALDEGRSEVLPLRPVRWITRFASPADVDLRFAVDAEVARATLRKLEGDALVSPVEPTIVSKDGARFTAVPGESGTGIDPDTLAVALAAAAADTPSDESVTVSIRQSALSPRLNDAVAESAARAANQSTSKTIQVTAAETTFELAPTDLRRLVRVSETADGVAFALDPEAILAVLETEFADLETQPADASFAVIDGAVALTPGRTGITCCGLESAEAIQDAFATGVTEVTVELVETEPDFSTEDAAALGIIEEVGSPDAFGPTTRHACCANRVTNIHRIADLVRGAVIEPGETFSVNEYVGRRTIEKGFVTDGVIYDGVLTEDVGGGVSQFATTLFNAALYAGLDFGDYQSHSLYISRYPRGHEATISFPAPDLQIKNPTDHGVLIWPEYTATSLTVRLYSTRHIDVSIGDPRPSTQGNCTRWTTPRTRTFADGTTVEDTVYALYRPREGVNC